LRENCTSRLSERAEAGRKLHLPRLYSDEAGEQSEESPLRRRLRGRTQRCRWSEGRGPKGIRTSKARTGLRARVACQRRWSVYGDLCRYPPEAGAVCGKAARTGLGGGRAMKRTSLPLHANIKRREFITLLGGAAAWPLGAHAQQAAMPVVGYLHSGSAEASSALVAAFRKGLSEAGFVEGQNVALEFRWAAGQEDRLREMAADLVRRRVAVIATPASTAGALAAKAATATIPIVFAVGGDPVAAGLVKSLNRPGGNVTGISFQTVELVGKELDLLRELAPQAKRFAALVNPNLVLAEANVKALQASAANLGVSVEILHASTVKEIDAAFADLAHEAGSALLISPDPFFTGRRAQLATLAARYAIPASYTVREFVETGGLMSYGPSFQNVYQLTGIYTGRVLKGDKPADLPVQQPTKFDLVINLTTARAIGITVPDKLLALADEVIE